MRVETVPVGPELTDVPARPDPVQLTLDDAPQSQPQQLDGIAKAMRWLHTYGPDRLDDLRRFTRLVGEIMAAVDVGDDDTIRAADRALTDARLEWEPTVTLWDIDQAELMHRAAACTDCWPEDADLEAPSE